MTVKRNLQKHTQETEHDTRCAFVLIMTNEKLFNTNIHRNDTRQLTEDFNTVETLESSSEAMHVGDEAYYCSRAIDIDTTEAQK